MDVQMPEMDGLEATRRLHEIAPRLPVIGLTAYALTEERGNCLAAGMVDHISKPVDPDALVATILRHLPGFRPAETIKPSPETLDAAPPALTSAPPPALMDGLLDWQALRARFHGRDAFISKLVATAADSLATHGEALSAALAQHDCAALAFEAHSIKGITGNLMATPVAALASAVDEAARRQDAGAFALGEDLARMTSALSGELAAQSPSPTSETSPCPPTPSPCRPCSPSSSSNTAISMPASRNWKPCPSRMS